MSAFGLSNLTSWGKAIKLEFDKLSLIRAQMLISIYHITLKLIWNRSICMQASMFNNI